MDLPFSFPLTNEDIIKILQSKVDAFGSINAAAKKLGISAMHLSDILRSNRGAGPKVLEALGLERVITYRRKLPEKIDLSKGLPVFDQGDLAASTAHGTAAIMDHMKGNHPIASRVLLYHKETPIENPKLP